MTYDPTWIRKSPILVPQAIQNASLTAQKGSVRLDALDWGQKVPSTILDSTQEGNITLSATTLDNGKVFVAWGAGNNGRYNILDSTGSIHIGTTPNFETGNFIENSFGLATTTLPNGDVVVVYAQNQGGENAVVFKIYNENGTLVRDTVTVKTHATETQYSVGVTALSDGRFVVVWEEGAVGLHSYFAIYDLDGDIVKGYTSLGGHKVKPQVAALTDGNWIVTYEDTGIKYQIFNRQGHQVLGETLFQAGATQAVGLKSLGNGQVVIPFTRGFGIIDRHGNVVLEPEDKVASGLFSITTLPHDNILVQNDVNNIGYYRVYNLDGTIFKAETQYVSSGDNITYGTTISFKNGNFIFLYLLDTSNELRFVINQGTKAGFEGDLNVDGSFSLASGVSVNEISDDVLFTADSDSIIVTQKSIKDYVDNSIGAVDRDIIYDGDSNVQVIDDPGDVNSFINVTIDGNIVASFNDDGLNLGITVGEFSNDDSLGGYNGALGSQSIVPTEFAVKTYIDNIHLSQREPTGFRAGIPNTFTNLGIDSSNIVYIEPTDTYYSIFFSGKRYIKTTKEQVEITDVEGMHHIYFDYTDGVLKQTTVFDVADLLFRHVYVASVYWDADNKKIIYLGDERHGCGMSGSTHFNLHVSQGTIYYTGLGIGDIIADGSGSLDTEAQISITNGIILDEDLVHYIDSETSPASLPIFYLDSTSNWRVSDPTDFPVINTGTGRVAYNKYDTGNWSLEEADNSSFVLMHIFATNDHFKQLISIVGQNQYLTLQDARIGASEEINSLVKGAMPFAEFLAIGTIIFETSDSFSNTPKAIIRTNDEGAEFTDWRFSGLTSGGASINNHGSLSGLGIDDHTQYIHVDGRRGITGNFDVSGNVEIGNSLEVENNIVINSGTLTLSIGPAIDEFSTDGTLAGDSNTTVPTEQAVKTYVDTSISNLNPDKIWANDSYVEVVDNGVDAGYVEIVADGTQVAYFDSLATTQRIGKETESRVVVADNDVKIYGGETAQNQVTINGSGLKLLNGGAVNEFSSDSDLASNSTTIVPTQYAIKTYVDTEINNVVTGNNQIHEGDSNVTVTDDGTTINNIQFVVNNIEVAKFEDDNQLIGHTNTYIDVNQTDNTIEGVANSLESFTFDGAISRIGSSVTGNSHTIVEATDTHEFRANNILVSALTPTEQTFGVAGDSRVVANQTTNTLDLYAGSTRVLAGAVDTIKLGVSEDTFIRLTQSEDKIEIMAGNQSQVLVETSGTTIFDDLTVTGNLFIDGTTFVVNQTEVKTADNKITLNYGEVGPGVTAGTAGIEVDRGTEPHYYFEFAENTDTFRVGELGQTQAVATREDDPDANKVAWWNNTERRFDTIGNSSITIDNDSTTGAIIFEVDNINVGSFNVAGLALQLGTRINEFSIDGTLAGNSNVAVPTEQAVKTYVDAQLGGQSHIIFKDDSKVEVIDDGVDPGYIQIVADGVQVAYFDAEATSIRVGKSGNSRLGITDTTLDLFANTTGVVTLSETSQIFGPAGADNITLNQTSNSLSITLATDEVFLLQNGTQRLGFSTANSVVVSQTNNNIVFRTTDNTTRATIADAGITLSTGATINEFSIDGTLAGNSDTAVPTEQAVKTYIDTAIFNLNPDKIWADDSYVEVVDDGTAASKIDFAIDGVIVQTLSATSQSFGSEGNSRLITDNGITLEENDLEVAIFTEEEITLGLDTNLVINQLANTFTFNVDSTSSLSMTSSGLRLITGAYINEFSTDGTLVGDSDTAVPTEQAVKTYVDSVASTTLSNANSYADGVGTSTLNSANDYTDTEIDSLRQQLDLINVESITVDSTAVTGDVLLINTTTDDVDITMLPSIDAKVIIKKVSTDGNKVNISCQGGTIDGQNLLIIDTPYQAFTFISDGSNFYIV